MKLQHSTAPVTVLALRWICRDVPSVPSQCWNIQVSLALGSSDPCHPEPPTGRSGKASFLVCSLVQSFNSTPNLQYLCPSAVVRPAALHGRRGCPGRESDLRCLPFPSFPSVWFRNCYSFIPKSFYVKHCLTQWFAAIEVYFSIRQVNLLSFLEKLSSHFDSSMK